MLAYTITHTEPWTYLNDLRNPVQGFRVTFTIVSLNETHTAYVPSLDPATVKPVIDRLLKDREGLMTLGK